MKLKNSLTTVLIVLIVGCYIMANYAPNITWGGLDLQDQLLLIKKAIFPDNQVHGVYAGEWWRIFTVAFTHASWLHLGSNMLAFFQLGNIVERYYGRARYAFLLLASLVISSFAALMLIPANEPCVGASGMIFGLFGVMLVSGKRMGVDYRQVLGLIVLNLVISFTVPNIAWQAHVGGLVGGYLAAQLLNLFNKPRSQGVSLW
jgi:membrane associated rhomboid family serine protease